MKQQSVTIDGNEAVARVAHKINEVIAIYPITPASPMGEWADVYTAKKERNIWGTIPDVVEMQSEGGASGAVHGSLQAGALTTTFTASQGLLLMLPNMYKIAGELSPTVIHVAARSLAAQALSIFGDHSDVMAVRQSGFAMIASGSVQEAHDFALISQSASLKSRIPFLHFFDGFRTSHEVVRIKELDDKTLKTMIDNETVMAHRNRALSPESPVLRGTSQNPDVYFQGRESVNPFYSATPDILQDEMVRFGKLTGRNYQLFDYVGAPDAERVIVMMGSGSETTHETVEYLCAQGEKIGVVKVRLYRPFSATHFLKVLPLSVRSVAVLDRTKEPGSVGEPLYLDILSTLAEHKKAADMPVVIGGRYGLSSKEFTPAMVKAVFDELGKEKPKNHFTIGIYDDVSKTNLTWDENFTIEKPDVSRALFYGLGSDGTVGANKNSIKIIGTQTDNHAQGYFVYDSKKSGSMTISHLRFGKEPIRSTYLIQKANFIACHQPVFLEKIDLLGNAEEGGIFLLNTTFDKDEVWQRLPRPTQKQIIEKKMRLFVINAYDVASKAGMGRRINTVMQTCFFAISGIVAREEAIKLIKEAIEKTYGKRGEKIITMNYKAVDSALEHLHEISIPQTVDSTIDMSPAVSGKVPDFVKNVTSRIIEGKGDSLPVSAIPADGTWPTGTTKYEKRNIALEVPVWDPETCIQCNQCVIVCPHAVIRAKVYDPKALAKAPETFKSIKAKGKAYSENAHYTLQVAVEDCTGCALCVEECPAKNKSESGKKAINMAEQFPLRQSEQVNWDFFLKLPNTDRLILDHAKVKDSQLLEPLFEFSGACPGCGETPYIKLASQLFGDRMVVANATGCSSIYGGNLPTTPWTKNAEGRGPAWSNSLFEDNAEFGLGFRLAIDKHTIQARELLELMKGVVGKDLAESILSASQENEADIDAQRKRVDLLKAKLSETTPDNQQGKNLLSLVDYLVKKSVWIIGGDGWAYDIGYGGLDHVLASGRNVNILVLDTQVYSNTGGQQSKATPTGAVAKFAAGGKEGLPKDLAMMAIAYGNVYVARIAMGSSDKQTVKAFIEAEAYNGPSIIIAYSHCIAHGYDLRYGMKQQSLAVETGLWPLFRYDPRRESEGLAPMQLDSKPPNRPVGEFMQNETRFNMVNKIDPARAKDFTRIAQHHANEMWRRYENLTHLDYPEKGER